MSKNNSINFWRVIFTFSIVIFHFSGTYSKFNTVVHAENGWRIAVEFFFVVSGFLLAYKCEHSEISAWEYTKHRFKRFFPVYFLSLIMMIVLRIINNSMSARKAFDLILTLIDELMLLQGLAWNYITINGPSWYISVLLICGYFIFYMLRKKKDFFAHFWAPLICIVVYSYLSIKMGRLSGNVYDFSDVLGFSIAMIRGFGGMCAGVISYEFYKKLKETKLTKFGNFLVRLGEIIGFSFILIYTFKKGSTHFDFYFVVIFIFCTAFAFSAEKKNLLFNNVIVDYLSKISFSIYLVHCFVLGFYKKIYPTNTLNLKMFIIFWIITIAIAALSEFLCSLVLKGIEIVRKKYGGIIIKSPKELKTRK
ncbi:MAG: acyltransferase [Acutalibacteraceae bacterium]|nr:acyltransferase [Acutalibacteraceae bacterium]